MGATKALGICDICGFRYPLKDLKKNSYGMMVCSMDYEGKYDKQNHPQNRIAKVRDDENIGQPEFKVVGFMDDNKQLHRLVLFGKIIYNPLELKKLIENTGISLVFLSLPTISRNKRNQIIQEDK